MIPPRKSAAFVWRMEEVLDLYEQPYDPRSPMICFDEHPCQMLGEVRDPLPMAPGKVRRFDSEYEREGMAYVHAAFEPLRGWREVEVSEHRRGLEFAKLMNHLAEEIYPDAEKIRLVCDNLSTHSPAAFYEAFSAEIAQRLARKIELLSA